ncbi:hypothetical protein QAD02_017545 [Eretmocerus hayati]|uniref:Uncharacterized protein n=1 Tax=Eretmocerus hayati TaxID=131215 RepID=A0ACC2PFD2_9HYME|nr:hypothetical protein QAD02_017545 [Eretmocerus hayati]
MSPRLMGGENSAIGEFPWLARLGYVDRQKRDDKIFRCDGSILSEFFIITSARCAIGNETAGKTLEVARLGEYNLETDPDCDGDFCADAYVDYIVTKTSIHQEYQESTRMNNIALVRVDMKIEFTKFIQPICLLIGKSGELMQKYYAGQNARLAAWGKGKDLDSKLSQSILQRLTVEVKDPSTCQDCQSPPQKLGRGQICAGGMALQGPCNDDGGAPLMVQELTPPRWYLLGMDSCGKCGSTIPHVYTRVTDYLLWILDRM